MATVASRIAEQGLKLVNEIAAEAWSLESFASSGLDRLPRLVASEVTTLSICDLARGRRTVFSAPNRAFSAGERAAFDAHFHEHPLVLYHSKRPGGVTHRISDSLTASQFRRTPLYNDYYRCVGIDHVMALPLYVDRRFLVSFVFNRKRRDFDEAERDARLRRHARAHRGLLAGLEGRRGRSAARRPGPLAAGTSGKYGESRRHRGERLAHGRAEREGAARAARAQPRERRRFSALRQPRRRGRFPRVRRGRGPHAARARGAAMGRGGQDQPRDRCDSRHEPAHGGEAFRAHFRKTRSRDAHGRRDALAGRLAASLNAQCFPSTPEGRRLSRREAWSSRRTRSPVRRVSTRCVPGVRRWTRRLRR